MIMMEVKFESNINGVIEKIAAIRETLDGQPEELSKSDLSTKMRKMVVMQKMKVAS